MVDNREELARDARKYDLADIKRGRAFAAMMKTEGWGLYLELLNNLIGTRTQNLFEPTPNGGRDIEQHNKGAVFGLIMARDLPSVTVAAMKEILDKDEPSQLKEKAS